MFVWIRKLWKKLSLKMANRRLTRHYMLINEYASTIQRNIYCGNQVSWTVILIKIPKSVEEIYLTLKCGDYNTYANGKHWKEFMTVLDNFYVEYMSCRINNRPLPDNEEIFNMLYALKCLSAAHACYLPKYTPENRYAFS